MPQDYLSFDNFSLNGFNLDEGASRPVAKPAARRATKPAAWTPDQSAAHAASRPAAVPAADGAISVSAALQLASGLLESHHLCVEGEVSKVSGGSAYKAVYFTLQDSSGKSAMKCLIWRNRYEAQGLELREGMRVVVRGKFSVYVARGDMQFYAERIEPAGEGDLRLQVDRLARKLRLEGLMDASRKRPIPAFCSHICVVTSYSGSVIHDVIRTLSKRNRSVKVSLVGTPVEGPTAVTSMIQALERAAQVLPDAILLVRGGGSYENLMPFNDESLARAVAACPVPVVTGIGHEDDTTICDLVSDRRSSTPTAAAQEIAPHADDLLDSLAASQARLNSSLGALLTRHEHHLAAFASRPVLARPLQQLVEEPERLLDLAHDRLVRAIPAMLVQRESSYVHSCASLRRLGRDLLVQPQAGCDAARVRLLRVGKGMLDRPEHDLRWAAGKLHALSPLAVVARGYALVTDEDHHPVCSVGQMAPGSAVDVQMKDGALACTVDAVHTDAQWLAGTLKAMPGTVGTPGTADITDTPGASGKTSTSGKIGTPGAADTV